MSDVESSYTIIIATGSENDGTTIKGDLADSLVNLRYMADRYISTMASKNGVREAERNLIHAALEVDEMVGLRDVLPKVVSTPGELPG